MDRRIIGFFGVSFLILLAVVITIRVSERGAVPLNESGVQIAGQEYGHLPVSDETSAVETEEKLVVRDGLPTAKASEPPSAVEVGSGAAFAMEDSFRNETVIATQRVYEI
jgi:hypothetical protein